MGSLNDPTRVKSFVVDPLTVWNHFTDSIPISVTRSLVLPLLLTVILWRRKALNTMIGASWLALTFAVSLFALLAERNTLGQPVMHGNWSWAIIPSTYALFLGTITAYCRLRIGESTVLGGFRWSWQDALVVATAGVYLLSGLFYVVGITTGDLPYAVL